MKRLSLIALLVANSLATAWAKNTKTTVEQVTEALSLTEDVDYHISGTTPFTADASLDIVNTEHAVVIFDSLKPSKAKSFLKYITINGKRATDGGNCQLKLYDRGAILLPYGGTLFRPLTVYDEKNFEGESNNSFTEGHSGGYMKNVPNAWNNRIRSFRLKRGYMVTFALKKAGKGYSRCFIANDADLEVTLPNLMDQRISSYRLFKWYDTSKAGVADVSASDLAKLNGQTTFTWSPGSSMLPDAECVPHRIDESWPSPAECGRVDYSPHLKNNNEPRNQSDHGTWTMDQILANWEAAMATGMRLCTPSSWDGSDYWNATGFLADFLNEIDKRGWRCDIIDLHGYWGEGSFTTNVNNWAQTFKRPVWITEWVWGASWSGGSGIFKEASSLDNPTAADLQLNKTVVSRILDNLNSNPACERYFYWNSERNCSKMLRDGKLTPAGEYFATMKTNGPGYTGYGNYIPKNPPAKAANNLKATFTPSTSICKLTWTPLNGDLANTVMLQRRLGTGLWTTIAEWTGAEIEEKSSMTYNDTITEPAAYSYRVQEKMYNNSTVTSDVVTNTLASARGTADVQFGTITSVPLEEIFTYFLHPFAADNEPIVVSGSVSNKNNGVGLVDNLMNINTIGDNYGYFRYRINRWAADESATSNTKETSTFIAAKPGHGKIGTLDYEADYVTNADGKTDISFDVTEVRFAQPFKTAPIVMIAPLTSAATAKPCMWRVWDVTPEGFKMAMMLESNITTGKTARRVGYLAIEKGMSSNGAGTLFCVGDTTLTFKTAVQQIDYPMELQDAEMMVQLQSYDYDAAAILRVGSSSTPTTDGRVRMQVDKSDKDKVLSSTRSATERVGYIILSTDPDFDAIRDINASTRIHENQNIYDLSGRVVNSSTSMKKGVYVVGGKKVIVK